MVTLLVTDRHSNNRQTPNRQQTSNKLARLARSKPDMWNKMGNTETPTDRNTERQRIDRPGTDRLDR